MCMWGNDSEGALFSFCNRHVLPRVILAGDWDQSQGQIPGRGRSQISIEALINIIHEKKYEFDAL